MLSKLIHLEMVKQQVEETLGYEVQLVRETKGEELVAFLPKGVEFEEIYNTYGFEEDGGNFFICKDKEGKDISDKVVSFFGESPILHGGLVHYDHIVHGCFYIGGKMYTDSDQKLLTKHKEMLQRLEDAKKLEEYEENMYKTLQKELTRGTKVYYDFKLDGKSEFEAYIKQHSDKLVYTPERGMTPDNMNINFGSKGIHGKNLRVFHVDVENRTVLFEGYTKPASLDAVIRS